MDIFEYLPQLIVAYDSDDEFANLIHVKKADRDKDYLCPCCGGKVKPRALDSNKEQSHYYHKTGKCTKESQLHFFCKNWLFEEGSKFYINDRLFEVTSIDIEKVYSTPFGDYKPDITVYTTDGKTIYFEIFFTNRKTGDDYFCKWESLGNDVVEVDIKEYMFKTDSDTIPSFTYLYHNGICYSKPYVKRDLYANTIAKIKHELTRQKVLNYKARIEQLDWFWQEIRNNTRESILDVVSKMEYEDMVSCYEIIKRKQCVSYLKEDILSMINQKVISDVRKSLDLPYDENVYFDLRHIRGRTYEAGIRLDIKTEHITYNDFYLCCNEYVFDKIKGYPKIVFNKNVHSLNEIDIVKKNIEELKEEFEQTSEYKIKLIEYENTLSSFEKKEDYKIRVMNNLYTILAKIHDNNFEVVFENYYMEELNIEKLSKEIQYKIKEIKNKEFLDIILNNDDYRLIISELQNYKNVECRIDIKYNNNKQQKKESGIRFRLYIHNKCVHDKILSPNFDDFIKIIDDCKKIIDKFLENHTIVIDLVKKINNCKNNFWKAEFSFDYDGVPEIKIDQIYFKHQWNITYEKIKLRNLQKSNKEKIISLLEKAMKLVMKNMELYGYRVMEVRD